jgi:PKD repeat protein
VIVHLKDGATLSYLAAPGTTPPAAGVHPFDAFFKNLDYNGGPVMTSNTNYTLYWSPSGAGAYPAGFAVGVNTYFEGLEHDSAGHQNVDSVATQYNDAAGEFAEYNSKFGGELLDTQAYPPNGCTRALTCLTDEQIKEELVRFISVGHLPTGLNIEYFVLTPEGVESCFEPAGLACSANAESHQAYCAYHGNIPLVGGAEIIYANDPFVNGKLCDETEHHINGPSDSALFGGLSHEHNESVTDPEPNNAWTDFGGSGKETGYEDGDKCRTFSPASEFGTPLSEVEVAGKMLTYNQEVDGHQYWYQQEWSNKGHECLQRLTFAASEAPKATFTSAAVAGNEVKFDAKGSTEDASDHYAWQFNDVSFPEPKTIETTGLTLNHTFPSPGTYVVGLTVFKPDGTSIGAAHTIKVGGPGPTAKIAVATASPTAGMPVAFSGAESTDPPRGSIATYTWDFGDGFEGSGATPSHAYAAVGSYTAKLMVTGSDGLTASISRQVDVAAPAGGGGGGGGGSSTAQTTTPTPTPTTTPTVAPVPNSSFAMAHASLNAKTGAITFTTSVLDPGIFSWLATFQNGKFGAFASSAKCKTGFVRLSGKCRPAKIVFARGSKVVPAAGTVSFTLRPSGSAFKALKNALRQKKGLPVTMTLTFQSSLGGSHVSRTQSLMVKLRAK